MAKDTRKESVTKRDAPVQEPSDNPSEPTPQEPRTPGQPGDTPNPAVQGYVDINDPKDANKTYEQLQGEATNGS